MLLILTANAPLGVNAVAPFSAKKSMIGIKRSLVEQKRKQRPGHTVNAPPPPLNLWDERPRRELASRLSEGNGAVYETIKGVSYIGRCFQVSR